MPKGNIEINAFGDKEVETNKTDNLPEVDSVLKELRQVADSTRDPIWGHKVVPHRGDLALSPLTTRAAFMVCTMTS